MASEMKGATDEMRRFLIEKANVRGEWVQLDEAWRSIAMRGSYPDNLRAVLGEAIAAVALLSATIKYDGSLILQIKGDGPVHLLVVQATSEGALRGLARWDEEQEISDLSFNDLFGQANVVITVQPDDDGERYQGIVALEGDNLSTCLTQYFTQSEQLSTRLWLAADGYRSAGMLLQQLPGDTIEDDDGWERLTILSDTVKAEELLVLEAETLLHRLFHQEDLLLFEADAMRFECTCSWDKINNTIRALGKEDALLLVEQQSRITIDCDFCNTNYVLDAVDVEKLFYGQTIPTNDTQH